MSTREAGTPHLLHVFATFAAAGPQIRTVRLIDALGGSFRHSILPMDGRREAAALFAGGAGVELLELSPAGPRAAALSRLMRALSPDALLTYNWGSLDAVLAACLRPGLPLAHHEDGFNDDEAVVQKRRRVWARRLLLRRARRVIVPSLRLEAIARSSWGVPAPRLRRIPNGIDLACFRPPGEGEGQGRALLRRELGVASGEHVVGSVGHLRPVKRFDRLIDACALVSPGALGGKPLHLVLVGDGSERERLEQRAARLDAARVRVRFVGHQRDLRPWYQAMDVFALVSDSEQHPVALIEAMACGLPVVATDVGDVAHVLPQDARGGLVAADGSGAERLARALEALLPDGARRRAEGESNRARALERFAFDGMLAAYRAVYSELVGA